MNQSILHTILDRFSQSKWALPTSAKHKESVAKLEEFSDEELIEAIESLKRTLARTMVTPDQIAAEIKMIRKRTQSSVKQLNDQILASQVEEDRIAMRNELKDTSESVIRAAVKYVRKVGVLDASPLSRNIDDWSAFVTGIVWASVQREKELAQ